MDIAIKDMKPGDKAFIKGFNTKDILYREKLLSMGLTKGEMVKLIKIAPLGDPVEIEIRGYKLSLRKAEADALLLRREA
ncbi:MAG TPA: FeoA family protein [Spirochaetota bacterium]|nr:FeoA family protein [Spirochaetota bacterium]HPI87861.1 FeoA family protein [Spirochaetota bacterium]HPR47407.1 FeoA family protein [Spirochaetota bacterium]